MKISTETSLNMKSNKFTCLTVALISCVASTVGAQRLANGNDLNPFPRDFQTIEEYGNENSLSPAAIAAKSQNIINLVDTAKTALHQATTHVHMEPSPPWNRFHWVTGGFLDDIAKSMCDWVLWVHNGEGIERGRVEPGTPNIGFLPNYWCDLPNPATSVLAGHEGQHTNSSEKWNDPTGYDSLRTARAACLVAALQQEALSISLEKELIEVFRWYAIGFVTTSDYCESLETVDSSATSYIDQSARTEATINALLMDTSLTDEDIECLHTELINLYSARSQIENIRRQINNCARAAGCW